MRCIITFAERAQVRQLAQDLSALYFLLVYNYEP